MDIPPLSHAPLQISASALISTLHQTFTNTQYRALRIDSTSAIYLGPNIEEAFISAVWDHAFRRSEDQALLVLPTHPAATTAFFSAVSAFPNANPVVGQALNVLTPFLTALTKSNISTRFHNGLAVAYSLNCKGDIISARIQIPIQPFVSLEQLTNLPMGERVFDVFYHLLLAESDRAEHLSLKQPEEYDLLNRGSFQLPDWVTFSDDYALAKDWSDGLRQCGIKGAALRGVLSTLSGILLLGNKSNQDDQQEGCALIGLDPNCLETHTTEELICSAYTTLVENVVADLNHFLSLVDDTFENEEGVEEDLNEVIAVVSIVECAPTSRWTILKNVFDNTVGINSELNDDGVSLPKTPAVVTKALTRMNTTVENISCIPDFRSMMADDVAYLSTAKRQPSEEAAPLDIEELAAMSRIWNVLSMASCADAESQARDVWSSQVVSQQIRENYITEWATKRRMIDFSADFGLEEFVERYNPVMPPDVGYHELEAWARQFRSWGPQEFYCGQGRVWLCEGVWSELEMALSGLDDPFANVGALDSGTAGAGIRIGAGAAAGGGALNAAPSMVHGPYAQGNESAEQQYPQEEYANPFDAQSALLPEEHRDRAAIGRPYDAALPYRDDSDSDDEEDDGQIPIDEDYARKYHGDLEQNAGVQSKTETVKMDTERRVWVWFVWMLTFWVPSPFLKYIARMRRSEVRMAWREKLVICFLITLLNGAIIFYMIFLGKMICPDYDKVWNADQLGTHQGENDFYVGVHGKVYDITHFYRQQHSDSSTKVTSSMMMDFAGEDLSDYFLPPLVESCPDLVKDDSVYLKYNQTKSPFTIAEHRSGKQATDKNSALHKQNWYFDRFLPKMKEYYKGRLVETKGDVEKKAKKDPNLMWAIIDNEIYDISNYMQTIENKDSSMDKSYEKWNFLDTKVLDMFQNNQGKDITDDFNGPTLDPTTRAHTLHCLKNTFHYGTVDFRNSAKCQTANYILLVIAGILTSVTVVKFLASIKFGSKKVPSPQDKFVVCQVPAYTESEDALRLAIDSLTALKYENSRKLLFVICDGMIVGAGNDRPTPQIVLDLFGIDEKIDPPTRAYWAVGDGARHLNYAKVYSGLYEFEGNIVPYIIVVKCGRKSETSKPGNRGKRDSQIMLMNFFNKVHYQKPMTPLELELFYQLNNVVGVDPELYEYLFMVDADTSVSEDALTRLVAQCANDSKVAGTCGETSLQNEEKSWATMIQVYEYFISHHLTKAFESLFGTVTCLPGCFSLYRMRTVKRAKPLIICNEVIRDYSEREVNTLHKKNLFSLGEDRYLTTLITKNFPKMKLTFVAEAFAQTAAPDELKVLLSQRRRWINSTVHNLVELLRLDNMCGFCCFGMRGVVFIDLVGTMMLPSVCIYLGYLIYKIAAHDGALPLISIILIAAVYGLQALVFVLRRQWQHIGWMIIYLAAYPIHSFLLPIYSFWNMDNFTWGNTRVVIGEKDGRQLVAVEDEQISPDDCPEETWFAYATRHNLKGAERPIIFDELKGRLQNQAYDEEYGYDMQELEPMDDRRKTIYDVDQISRGAGGGGGGAMSLYSDGMTMTRPYSTYTRQSFGAVPAQRMSWANHSSRMSLGPSSRMSAIHSVHENSGDASMPDLYDEHRDTHISESIRQVLQTADLDNMTKRQLRERVEDMMGVAFTADKVPSVDKLIDEELERMDEEADSDESDGTASVGALDDLKSLEHETVPGQHQS